MIQEIKFGEERDTQFICFQTRPMSHILKSMSHCVTGAGRCLGTRNTY